MKSDTRQPDAKSSKKGPVKGSGLTKPGVVILQFLWIFLIAFLEISIRSNVGFMTGIAILLAYYTSLIYGRKGTTYVAVVNPPIAFALSTLILLPSVGGLSLSITRLGIDLVSGLASVAPYLIVGALYGWWYYFKERRNSLTR